MFFVCCGLPVSSFNVQSTTVVPRKLYRSQSGISDSVRRSCTAVIALSNHFRVETVVYNIFSVTHE